MPTATKKDKSFRMIEGNPSDNFLVDMFLERLSAANIEQRAYMIENVLPTLIIGCEKLAKEIAPISPIDSSATGKFLSQQGKRIRKFDIYHDNLPTDFNPIRWLAQYLFRNNPRHSQSSRCPSYISAMSNVQQELKQRLRELQKIRIESLEAQKREQGRNDVWKNVSDEQAEERIRHQMGEFLSTGSSFMTQFRMLRVLKELLRTVSATPTKTTSNIKCLIDKLQRIPPESTISADMLVAILSGWSAEELDMLFDRLHSQEDDYALIENIYFGSAIFQNRESLIIALKRLIDDMHLESLADNELLQSAVNDFCVKTHKTGDLNTFGNFISFITDLSVLLPHTTSKVFIQAFDRQLRSSRDQQTLYDPSPLSVIPNLTDSNLTSENETEQTSVKLKVSDVSTQIRFQSPASTPIGENESLQIYKQDFLRKLETLTGATTMEQIATEAVGYITDFFNRVYLSYPGQTLGVEIFFVEKMDNMNDCTRETKLQPVLNAVAVNGETQVGTRVSDGAVADVALTGIVRNLILAIVQPAVVSPMVLLSDLPEVLGADARIGPALLVPIASNSSLMGVLKISAMHSGESGNTVLQSIRENGGDTSTVITPFEEFHLRAVESAAHLIAGSLESIRRRKKFQAIAASSVNWFRQAACVDVDFYFVESPGWNVESNEQNDDRIRLFHLQSDVGSQSKLDDVDDPETHNQEKETMPPLTEISSVDSTKDFIFRAASTGETQLAPVEHLARRTAIPIFDEETKKVIAVVVAEPVLSKDESFELTETDTKCDAEAINAGIKAIEKAFTEAHKNRNERTATGRRGKSLDHSDKEEVLFGKFILNGIRELIAKLDSSAIAELKSYKKPPLTIHKVMKCVLYVFGKTPKELKSWIETTKLINMELLKQMINYDPTVLQPKNRFIRIKKLLKTIPRGDVKRKGSMPALIVFSWLIVSLDLREKAVASRLALQKNEKGDTLMADSDNSNSLEDNDIDEFSDEESESIDELRNSATDLAISSS